MKTSIQKFYGHGKLLLTGEYAVLDGAKALSVPTKFGQSLEVKTIEDNQANISWKSYTNTDELWLNYNSKFKIDNEEHLMLEKILDVVKELNSNLFKTNSFEFSTKLEFDRKWGLGSSSTLLYCLSKWAKIDPFVLLEKTFGGSGYDLASAGEDKAIFYTKKNKAIWETLDLKFPFKEKLYFVYLGKKKNSREAITHYREEKSTKEFLDKITKLSKDFSKATELEELQGIMIMHENILSKRLKTPTLNKSIFNDTNKLVAKSLGGWGGDFILIATDLPFSDLKNYLSSKKLNIVLKWKDMVL